MITFDRERDWALYQRSDGGEPWLAFRYESDQDVFTHAGITYTRIGPIVRAYTPEHAREQIDAVLARKEAL